MKKLYIILFVLPFMFFSIGCDTEENEDDNLIDPNLFGTYESEVPFELNEDELFLTIYNSCEGEYNVQVSDFDQNSKITIQFSYPNNYIINHDQFNIISTGTFYTENNSIFFSGSFKNIFLSNQGENLGSYDVTNIDFYSNYNIFLSELSLSEFFITSDFNIDIGMSMMVGSENCFLFISNSSLESSINNSPFYLDNRTYLKIN